MDLLRALVFLVDPLETFHCVSGEVKKHGSLKLAGMLALKLKKKPATPARKGVNQLSKEMHVTIVCCFCTGRGQACQARLHSSSS